MPTIKMTAEKTAAMPPLDKNHMLATYTLVAATKLPSNSKKDALDTTSSTDTMMSLSSLASNYVSSVLQKYPDDTNKCFTFQKSTTSC